MRQKALLCVLQGGAGWRRCPDLSWLYGKCGEVSGSYLLFSEKRFSCILYRALRARAQLPARAGFVARTYRLL